MIHTPALAFARILSMAFLFSLSLSVSLYASDTLATAVQTGPQSLFNEGNYFLEQQRYEDAALKYSAIRELGYESGPLYLNLAICHTHLDSLGLAKFYFLKASGFRQTRNAAEDGINHIDMILRQVRPDLPVLPVAAFYDRLYFEIGSLPFLVLTIVLFNLAAACLIFSWLSPRMSGWLQTIAILLLLGGAGALGTGIFVDEQSLRYSKAVLITNDSVVREQPFTDAPVVASAHIGYEFTVDTLTSQGDNNWLYVRLTNGLEGWVPGDGVRKL